MRELLRTGAGAILVIMIMTLGSLVLWIGTPLLWLWVGSQVEARTASLGGALGVTFLGAVVTIVVVAGVLSRLSNIYRSNALARGRTDPGHFVLEVVLVISASFTLLAFVVWFFFFAGAEPLPIGIKY